VASTPVERLSDSGEMPLPVVSHDLPEFATVMRGYDRGQVEDYVIRLQEFLYDAELRATNADRRVMQAQRRMEDLERELSRAAELAESPAAVYDGLGERIATILRLAAEEADSIRSAARDDADTQLEETRREREHIKSAAERDLADLSRRRDGVVTELNRVRDVLTALGLSGQAEAATASDVAAAAQSDEDKTIVIDLADRQAAGKG
jgi:cell division septum initiation protein DivIVA